MTLKPGEVYSPKGAPELVWVVVEATEATVRGAYLTVPESLQRSGVQPGGEFEFPASAVFLDGLERLA